MKQIEMGYRFTASFLEFVKEQHADRKIFDESLNGGRVVVVLGVSVPGAFPEAAAFSIYICEDAQAWGTFTLCDNAKQAIRKANSTLTALRKAAA